MTPKHLYRAHRSIQRIKAPITMINMATFKRKMARMHVLDPCTIHAIFFVGNLSPSKQLLALMLSTLARPYYYSFREWTH